MHYFLIFLILTILLFITLIRVLIKLIMALFSNWRKNEKNINGLKRALLLLIALFVLNIFVITISQATASTPKITDEKGKVVENSISEMIQVDLNGRKQWITIRGWNRDNPVLLFLAGGPGGTQMAAVRYQLAELEKHFIVVNWDQPGSGKSYFAERNKNITVDTYIEDGYVLTEYLKERFFEEKIYLIGESWGSALGIFLISKYPDIYHAFIGTGQMVSFVETERIDYYKAIEIAEQKNNTKLVEKLKANGEPPYYGDDLVWKSALYLNYLSSYMASLPNVHNPGYNTFRDVLSSEYGLLDKINFFRGIIYTFNNVYQKLYDIDLRRDYINLEVPVYFFLGRYDYNAPTSLVKEYVEVLNAPEKKIVWFEHSAHSPWINETDKFVEEVLSCFLEK